MLGLSATVARKDGHHPIIFMQCGPVRYRVDAKAQAATRAFTHTVKLRETGFRLPPELEFGGPIADVVLSTQRWRATKSATTSFSTTCCKA